MPSKEDRRTDGGKGREGKGRSVAVGRRGGDGGEVLDDGGEERPG